MRMTLITASLFASSVAADFVDPLTEVDSGRFHLQVEQTEGYGFRVTATPTEAQSPMQPVNEAGLHLSCFLIPDLLRVDQAEAEAAMSVAAGRYCRAQFGDDQIAEVGGAAPSSVSDAFVAAGTCQQAPL